MILLYIKNITKPLRHKISRFISPNLCRNKFGQRPFIDFLEKKKLKNLVGAEVGIMHGENALNIISKLNIKRLYLIDNYPESNEYIGIQEDNKHIAINRLGHLKNIFFIFKDSTDLIIKSFIKEKLDFVYIDAEHSYMGCDEDIRFYWDMIKSGGYLGGHDFYGSFIGVILSVLNFVEEKNLIFYTDNFDYWMQKP